MKKLILGGAVILSSGLAGIAEAAPITWDTISNSSSTIDSCSGGAGNSCTFDNGVEILSARAYSTDNNNGSGAFEKATINVYGGGIGVRNPDHWNEGLWPNHAVDSNGRDDLVVFEYDGPYYNPTGFMIGWKHDDADVRAWIGGEDLVAGYDFTGKHFSDLTGLGFTSFNFSNVSVDTLKPFNSEVTGRYLILAPRNGNDYFKISQISGTTAVTEPGTAALLGIALAGFWANRRRKS